MTDESRRIAQEQTNLLKYDLENTQKTVDAIKSLMIDPASALLVAQAGVSLNDTVETINAKMAQAQYANEVREMSNEFTSQGAIAIIDPSSVPKDQLRSFTDSKGKVHYYKMPKEKTTTTGTASERAASNAAAIISKNSMNFTEAIDAFANQLSLSEIYTAYAQSEMGKKYGLPKENPQAVALAYKVARGEMTAAEAREILQGE